MGKSLEKKRRKREGIARIYRGKIPGVGESSGANPDRKNASRSRWFGGLR